MIGVCTKCGTMYETSTEDAYAPDRVCPRCYWGADAPPWERAVPGAAVAVAVAVVAAAPHPALERVEKLKADRRAELARAEAERRAKEVEREAREAAAWERDVAAALDALGLSWLYEFRAPEADTGPYRHGSYDTHRGARFAVPGHRLVSLLMDRVDGHERTWKAYSGTATYQWEAQTGYKEKWGGCETLADALMAAEPAEGDTPPDPSEEE